MYNLPPLQLKTVVLLAALTSPVLAMSLHAQPRVVIDGEFGDWIGEVPRAEDPRDAASAELDLLSLGIVNDDEAVYFELEFDRVVLLQGLTGTAALLLDADGDPDTGDTQLGVGGVDAMLVFSPPAPGWVSGARGTSVRSIGSPGGTPGAAATSYELGLIAAPTHASNRFEIRVDRGLRLPGTSPLLVGDQFSIAFALVDPLGEIKERSDVLTYRFGERTAAAPSKREEPDPLARPSDTDLRVLSWNIGNRSILDNPEPFRRILAAVDPDIMMFDEVSAEMTPEMLLEALGPQLAEGRDALIGAGGGRQHAAVVARESLRMAPGLERIPYPTEFPQYLESVERDTVRQDLANAATDGVSSAGFLVKVGKRQLLVVPVDVQCCGRLGEPEDRIRQIQAQAIHDAVSKALPELQADGIIIAGDLNLVGMRMPLAILESDLDLDGTSLVAINAIQLDGRSNATWGFGGPFSHSRLDYFLYGDSTLMPLDAFVLDARDLDPKWGLEHAIRPQDIGASGHLPIVVDLHWTQ